MSQLCSSRNQLLQRKLTNSGKDAKEKHENVEGEHRCFPNLSFLVGFSFFSPFLSFFFYLPNWTLAWMSSSLPEFPPRCRWRRKWKLPLLQKIILGETSCDKHRTSTSSANLRRRNQQWRKGSCSQWGWCQRQWGSRGRRGWGWRGRGWVRSHLVLWSPLSFLNNTAIWLLLRAQSFERKLTKEHNWRICGAFLFGFRSSCSVLAELSLNNPA